MQNINISTVTSCPVSCTDILEGSNMSSFTGLDCVNGTLLPHKALGKAPFHSTQFYLSTYGGVHLTLRVQSGS